MTITSNELILRPRFKLELSRSNEDVLQLFEKKHSKKSPFVVKRIDNHVFIKLTKEESHFWSPQLHLEIDEVNNSKSELYGLFGPNPTLWTFFMFLHFGIATIFIIFGVWAYSNWSLNQSYAMQLGVMVLMVFCWGALYFIGRMGKAKGKVQMNMLYTFMKDVIND
ncbi:GTP-binding protein [Leptobacterium sp. I13]|uniref:GTP-binding protein n=1 Tax=Leptobacterium meishanense TaxID=3128904 RepID=UPI0030EB42AB